MSKVGVLFGTYNPIHNGHLLISTVLLNSGYFDKVIYSVAKTKYKQGEEVLSVEQRMTMLYRAFNETKNHEVIGDTDINEQITISNIETRAKTWKVYDCFEKLKEENPNDEFCLVIGADQMAKFHTWYRFQDLLDKYNVHCIRRDGQINFQQLCCTLWGNGINVDKITFTHEFPQIDISSTKIRQLVKENKSIDFYVPYGVKKYIQMNKLYK